MNTGSIPQTLRRTYRSRCHQSLGEDGGQSRGGGYARGGLNEIGAAGEYQHNFQ